MTRAAPFLLCLALAAAGCDRAPEAGGEAASTTKGTPAPQGPTWTVAGGSEGVALRATSAGGEALLTLDCPLGAGRLVAHAPSFRLIGSEDRFTLGLDDEPTALVADLKAQGPGVRAAGPLDAALLARIEAARTVSANYGDQLLGPLPLPQDKAREFAAGCRAPGGSP